jgi:hypothetical protein
VRKDNSGESAAEATQGEDLRAQPGRPTEDLDDDLAPAVRAFAKALRDDVFEPCKARGWPLRRIAGRLAETRGKGYSLSTLQRIASGGRVPTRDILEGIVDLIAEVVGQPMRPQPRQALTALYYAALKVASPQLYEFYMLLEERDAYLLRSVQLADQQEHLRIRLAQAEQERARLHSELAAVRGRVLAAGQTTRAVTTARTDSDEQLADLGHQAEATEAERRLLGEELARVREELAALRDRTDHHSTPPPTDHDVDERRLRDQLQRAQQAREEAEDQLAQVRVAIRRQHALRQRQDDELAQADTQRKELAERLRELQDKHDVLHRTAAQLREALDAARAQADHASRALADSEQRLFTAYREHRLGNADGAVTGALEAIHTEMAHIGQSQAANAVDPVPGTTATRQITTMPGPDFGPDPYALEHDTDRVHSSRSTQRRKKLSKQVILLAAAFITAAGTAAGVAYIPHSTPSRPKTGHTSTPSSSPSPRPATSSPTAAASHTPRPTHSSPTASHSSTTQGNPFGSGGTATTGSTTGENTTTSGSATGGGTGSGNTGTSGETNTGGGGFFGGTSGSNETSPTPSQSDGGGGFFGGNSG